MADSTTTPEVYGRGYRVLARKYRPASFEALIGQDAMVRTLSNAFETGRIPQGWMLTGVRGVGKTTTARILARALNYETAEGSGKPTIHMPGLGVHCAAIIDGRHMDVQEMDAASHTSINDIRELIDAARYKPMTARYKVYIIDEVHMLSISAFNGLLKTLEEPPEHVKFIFATTEIRKVPVTVLSRCQRFDLRRVEASVLVAHLQRVAAAESVTLQGDAAALIARAAEGSVRDSLSLLDQAIAHGDGAVTADVVRGMLGLADRLRVFDVLESALSGDARAALSAFDAQYRDGADPVTVVGELIDAVHAVTRTKVTPDAARETAGPEAEIARLEALSGKLSLKALTRAWQLSIKGLAEVQAAPRPVAAAEMLIVRLAHASTLPTPDEVIRALGEGADQGAPPGRPVPPSSGGGASALARPAAPLRAVPEVAAAPRPDPPAPARAKPAEGVALSSFTDLVALAQAKRDVVAKIALERQVHLVRFEPERHRLEFRLADGAAPAIVADLQRKLGEWTGERWMLVVSKEDGDPTLQQQAEARQQTLLDDVRSDPTVAAVLARFPGAEIVDVRVLRGAGETAADGAPEPAPIEADDDDL